MKTEVVNIDAANPNPHIIEEAAAIIRGGGLVVIPTETVYGLGANALDPIAVHRIFEAKQRPASNPLIVHVADLDTARTLSSAWPAAGDTLARRFWAGPLTMVVKKSELVPPEVTAGGSTVAVRMPSHAVALALIRAAGVPIAAPSANSSTSLSPTRADHVLKSLKGKVDMILDAGQTSGGIESTVIDLTLSVPKILRPGLIPPAELDRALKIRVRWPDRDTTESDATPAASPGQMKRHYAPDTHLEAVEGNGYARVQRLVEAGNQVALLTFGEHNDNWTHERLTIIPMPDDPAMYAQMLYLVLHDLDTSQHTRIVVELPPTQQQWLAVRDRLLRAAAKE